MVTLAYDLRVKGHVKESDLKCKGVLIKLIRRLSLVCNEKGVDG